VEALRMGSQIALAGPEGHRLSPVFIDDVVDVIVWATTHDLPGTFNVGGPASLTDTEIAQVLSAHLHEPLAFVETPNTPVSVAVSTDALDRGYPTRKRTSFPDGVAASW